MIRIGWVALFVGIVFGQEPPPEAHCDPNAGLEWSYNSLGQDPCKVASYLGSVCTSGVLTIPPLDPGNVYQGPEVGKTNRCRCSTVFYSLLSACAKCQQRNVMQWSRYKVNCTTVYESVFLDQIPSATAVGHWAYLNVTVGDTFNDTLAKQDALSNRTESVGPPQPTGSSTPSSPVMPSDTSSAGSKTNVGAIAGGVVGGVVGVALAVVAAILLIRRRRNNRRPPSSLVHYGPDGVTPTFYGTSSFSSPTPKLYDPSDPTTFPAGSPPHSPDPYNISYGQLETQQGRYTGAPQI